MKRDSLISADSRRKHGEKGERGHPARRVRHPAGHLGCELLARWNVLTPPAGCRRQRAGRPRSPFVLCFSRLLYFAALSSAHAAIQAAAQTPEAPDPLAELRDSARLVEVPWPEWVWWAIGAGSLLLVSLIVWAIVRFIKSRPKPLPPTPRELAMRALNTLRGKMLDAEPYAFSVSVSDVLRTFISAHYALFATQQTSPEFLASIASSPRFSPQDREALAVFLERCDLLKFARVEAGSGENMELLREAEAFVQGGGR